ncbi:hypothetical protein CJ030_MR6G010840 [Morella rubra]|uniref:Pentatricopeptide repeat-containing protein n=1 Tax=Morella rubra TaxID=262757 RepID=A0A6A1VCR6_9ROSI|nr:hypothetical protein CJ030_MR6G010840 [Morella rubra]
MKSIETLFKLMPGRDIISWNSLITGFAQNGFGKKSLCVFQRMLEAKMKPNSVTFLGVLTACNHTGLVSKGMRIIDPMQRDYDVNPIPDHYAILIDLLGRKKQT